MKNLDGNTAPGRDRVRGVMLGLIEVWLIRTTTLGPDLREAMKVVSPLECLDGQIDSGKVFIDRMQLLEKFWAFILGDASLSILGSLVTVQWNARPKGECDAKTIARNRPEIERFITRHLSEEIGRKLKEYGFFADNSSAIATGKRHRKIVTTVMDR